MKANSYQYPSLLSKRPKIKKQIQFAEPDFEIKSYYKGELAAMYGVHVNTLSKWIDRHYEKFAEIGYHKNLRVLDPAMIKLFIHVFDTP